MSARSEDGAGIALPEGRYAVRVDCKVGESTLSPPVAPIRVRAGRASEPRIDARAARLRIMAKRNGKRIAATVALHRSGSEDGEPLAEGAANTKFTVASGTYDALVIQDGETNAQAWLRRLNVRGSGVTERHADLSDGRIIVHVKQNRRRADAGVRIFAGDGETQIAVTEPGKAVAVAPGRYVVQSTLLDAADLATDRATVWVTPKKTAVHVSSFETGTLTVNAVRDGRALDATVHLSMPGAADFFNFFPAPGTVSLTPGKYDVTIELTGTGPMTHQSRSGVIVLPSRNTKLKFDVTPATLEVQVLKSGKTVVTADCRVRAAGGGAEAGTTDANGKLRLWPGRYEIVAVLADGTELVDGPFDVALGQRLRRVVRYARGTLSVKASRGSVAAGDAEVSIYKPGAKVPLAKALAQSQIELPPGVYDVKVIAGHETRWTERVRIDDGKRTKLAVSFTAVATGPALPEGSVPAPDEELPEGDAEPLPDGDADG